MVVKKKNYKAQRKRITRMFERNGTIATMVQDGTNFDRKAIFKTKNQGNAFTGFVSKADRLLLVLGDDLQPPQVRDTLTFGNDTYSIEGVDTLAPDGVTILLWTLELTKKNVS